MSNQLIVKDPSDYDMTLLVMVASGIASPDEVCDAHNLTHGEYDKLLATPLFRQQVEGVRADLLKNGSMISIRAGYALAEVGIPEMQSLMQAVDTPPADKVKAMMALIKAHEVGRDPKAQGGDSKKAGVSIVINTNPVPVGRPHPTIEVKAVEVDDGDD